jgi:hypothetical protein
MSVRLSEQEYQMFVARVSGAVAPVPAKPHKYHAQKVQIDGHVFASKWEGQCYVDLWWQAQAGLITFPLLQVGFSLGQHYGRERVYIADFTHIDLQTGCLVVADAKGYATPLFRQKKRVFEQLYGLRITEYHRGGHRET